MFPYPKLLDMYIYIYVHYTIPFPGSELFHPFQDPQMQERGLDVLRLLSTRRDAVTQQLCRDETFVPAAPWKNPSGNVWENDVHIGCKNEKIIKDWI